MLSTKYICNVTLFFDVNTASMFNRVETHQDNVRDRDDDETASEVRSKIRSDSLRSVNLLWDPLEGFLVLGHGVEIVAYDRPQPGVDVEDGVLEYQGVAVHLHLPLAGPQTTEQKEAVLLW